MNDQIKTDTGYKYGGTTYQNQERTDSQGNKYTVAIPISSVTTAPTAIKTPSPTAPVDYNAMTAGIATPYDIAAQQEQESLASQQQGASDINNLMQALSGKSAFEGQQAESLGLNAANQEYITKAAELSSLNKQAAAAQQQNISQGRQLGSIGSFVAGQGSEIERNRAIQAMTIGAELDAIKGRIDVAQSKVKQAVDLKYAQQEQDLANRLKMFDINSKIYDTLSKSEQKQWDRAKYATEQKEKKLAEEKKSFEDIQNMIIEATPNAPRDVIAKAKKLADSGASKLAVAQSLGVYGGEYLKNELLREQINKAKADVRETNAKINAINEKTDGTNLTGKPLKVSNTEITNLNEALTARDSVNSLVAQFKQNIADYGTQTVFGKGSGDREALRTNLLLAIKNMEKTGALDAGTINVLEGTIPSSKFFATEAAQQAALDTLLNTVNSKTDSYINSYKGTSAEEDPRTKRAYETAPVVSSGNPQADEYFKMTSGALQNINTQMSTPSAAMAGYSDNQIKQ